MIFTLAHRAFSWAMGIVLTLGSLANAQPGRSVDGRQLRETRNEIREEDQGRSDRVERRRPPSDRDRDPKESLNSDQGSSRPMPESRSSGATRGGRSRAGASSSGMSGGSWGGPSKRDSGMQRGSKGPSPSSRGNSSAKTPRPEWPPVAGGPGMGSGFGKGMQGNPRRDFGTRGFQSNSFSPPQFGNQMKRPPSRHGFGQPPFGRPGFGPPGPGGRSMSQAHAAGPHRGRSAGPGHEDRRKQNAQSDRMHRPSPGKQSHGSSAQMRGPHRSGSDKSYSRGSMHDGKSKGPRPDAHKSKPSKSEDQKSKGKKSKSQKGNSKKSDVGKSSKVKPQAKSESNEHRQSHRKPSSESKRDGQRK
jgi:hypothetical protein